MYLFRIDFSAGSKTLDQTKYNGKFAAMKTRGLYLTNNNPYEYEVVEKCGPDIPHEIGDGDIYGDTPHYLVWIDCPQPQCGRKAPQTLQQASLKASSRSIPIKNQPIQRRSLTDTDGSWTFLDELSLQSPGIMAVIY